MNEVNSFSEIRIEPKSKVNKALTEYTFIIEGTVNAQSEDVLEIKFPNELSVGAEVECLGESYNLSPYLQCETDPGSNKLRIVLAVINWGRVLYTGL